jgi:hypothetical protein
MLIQLPERKFNMNRMLHISLSLTLLAPSASLLAQGTFQDLDFEAARLIFVSTNGVGRQIPTTDALPGWEAFSGTDQLPTVTYDQGGAFPSVELMSSNAAPGVSGNFAVFVSPSTVAGYGPGSISQTALVPANAQSLLFDMTIFGSVGLSVSLGGQQLSYTIISSYPYSHYSLYGANISAFAGKTETLTFSALDTGAVLDDIQFSSQPVPEPFVLPLLLLGCGILASLRLCRGAVLVKKPEHSSS